MFDWLATQLVFGLLDAPEDARWANALHFFVMDTALIFTLLVVVIYAMGWLRALMSPERVRAYVRGKPPWLARTLAIALGGLTPFCSCSSVPLFIGFVEAGVPLGVTFSFLIASPMINEIAVVLLAGILGWELALMYVVAGVLVAWFGGVIMQAFRPERWVEDYVWKIQMGEMQPRTAARGWRQRHAFAWFEVKEIVGRIWKWVVIGIAVGAVFHGFVPGEWVTEHLGQAGNWLAVPAAVALGIPLYANATGIIPVAEAMLGKGAAIGTTLAFMMSVAALSLPEILILRKVIRWPALALFVAVLAVGFVLVGWAFNAVT
ncbi:MAG: permease [Guyparkeria sp.]|uniref:permease n=1 Tax=Guyparkeria sp. TaxID=2035736 RepID=UPI0039787FE8